MAEHLYKVGLAGVGSINSDVANAIATDNRFKLYTVSAATNDNKPSKSHADSVYVEPHELAHNCDIMIEALPPEAAVEYVLAALKADKTVILCSVGILSTHPEILEAATRSKGRIIVPYGAIMTVPNIKELKNKDIHELHHTVTKPIAGLEDALRAQGYSDDDIANIDPDEPIFKGSAEEAIKLFGKNVNTSIAISLLCERPASETNVTIYADKNAKGNTHHVQAKGYDENGAPFEFDEKSQNKASKNPGTSVGTSESVLRALLNPVRDGIVSIGRKTAQVIRDRNNGIITEDVVFTYIPPEPA